MVQKKKVNRLPIERFLEKVDTNSKGCWLWRGTSTPHRPVFSLGSASEGGIAAARFSYLQFIGEIPDGYEIDHLCRNPSCMKPSHLEPVTPEENKRRHNAALARGPEATHCLHGHEWNEENSYVYPRGMTGTMTRHCRQCDRNFYQYGQRDDPAKIC